MKRALIVLVATTVIGCTFGCAAGSIPSNSGEQHSEGITAGATTVISNALRDAFENMR